MLPALRAATPRNITRYFEPFIGGGAMYLDLDLPGNRCTIGDTLAPLTAIYRCARDCPQELLEHLELIEYLRDRDSYEALRRLKPDSTLSQAAWMLYIIATSFKGLYRENNSGECNAPYGDGKQRPFIDAIALVQAWRRLEGTTIVTGDYADTCAGARSGDFVYFDPPYLPLSDTASFSSYAAGGFSRAEHERLAAFIGDLTRRGVRVMLSNSDCPAARDIYSGLNLYMVRARRRCGASRSARSDVTEILGLNYFPEEMVDGNGLLALAQPIDTLF